MTDTRTFFESYKRGFMGFQSRGLDNNPVPEGETKDNTKGYIVGAMIKGTVGLGALLYNPELISLSDIAGYVLFGDFLIQGVSAPFARESTGLAGIVEKMRR